MGTPKSINALAAMYRKVLSLCSFLAAEGYEMKQNNKLK